MIEDMDKTHNHTETTQDNLALDLLPSFERPLNIVVVGATGGLGLAVSQRLLQLPGPLKLWACGRQVDKLEALQHFAQGANALQIHALDFNQPHDIAHTAGLIRQELGEEKLRLCLVCTGFLHEDGQGPEKKLADLQQEKLLKDFALNAVAPALIAQQFIPLMPRRERAVFAALSARVGSIGDNRLGGWYGYRASKAALNMLIKTTAIESARRKPGLSVIAYHPGTVNTPLSEPFQRNVPAEKLFSPDAAARYFLQLLNNVTPEQSGKHLDWQGRDIEP